MVNMQPGNNGEQQWYPQLPEGYEQQPAQRMVEHETRGWSPGVDMQGYGMQEQNMTDFAPQGFQQEAMEQQQGPMVFQQEAMGFQQGPIQGMPNFGPQHGFPPEQGMPNFGPPPGNQQWQSDPGMPWFGPPGTQGQQGQQGPQGPPPNFSPPYPAGGAQLLRVDPGAISGCLHRFTYVWLSRRQGFWFFPTFVGRTSVAGYRWRSRQRRWEYFGIDLNRIDSFSCF